MAKQQVESSVCAVIVPFEVIDPHAGIDKDQLSLLIAFRSPSS